MLIEPLGHPVVVVLERAQGVDALAADDIDEERRLIGFQVRKEAGAVVVDLRMRRDLRLGQRLTAGLGQLRFDVELGTPAPDRERIAALFQLVDEADRPGPRGGLRDEARHVVPVPGAIHQLRNEANEQKKRAEKRERAIGQPGGVVPRLQSDEQT